MPAADCKDGVSPPNFSFEKKMDDQVKGQVGASQHSRFAEGSLKLSKVLGLEKVPKLNEDSLPTWRLRAPFKPVRRRIAYEKSERLSVSLA